jgi:hypothetical protein
VTFYALFALEAHVIYITLFALVGSGTYLATPVVTESAVTVSLPHQDTIFGEVVEVVHCLAFLSVPLPIVSAQLYIVYPKTNHSKHLFYVMCAT